jgi:hypothetical protein
MTKKPLLRILIAFCFIYTITIYITSAVAQISGARYVIDPDLGFYTGPAVGDTVPDFTLKVQRGDTRRSQQLIGQTGAILNFYRSASW